LHHVTSTRPEDPAPGTAGPPLDGYALEVRDVHGEPQGEGQAGELWISGPTMFAGYWRRPDLTARTHQDGWLRTGDLVRIVDGRLIHEGRMDDLMKLGGMWVAPATIESVLRRHPGVRDAAVVAVGEETGVPRLAAQVVTADPDPALSSDLARWCAERLAPSNTPIWFEFVEELPRTASGKLRRSAVRAQARARAGPGPSP
jgi:acyl-CoA synthetase (AMP-forming)/AMP-acid ligase II